MAPWGRHPGHRFVCVSIIALINIILLLGEMLDLVTMMEANVFRTSSTLRLLPGKEETVVCAAFNEAFPTERLSSPVKLRVRHPPSVELTFTSPSTVSVGETVELECHATAYPANLTYAWTIDGRKVEDEEGRSLKVKNVNQEADGSIVTCQVSQSPKPLRLPALARILTFKNTFAYPAFTKMVPNTQLHR